MAFISKSAANTYRLRSVVHHIGECAQRGHYTTDSYCRPHKIPLGESPSCDSNTEESWIRFDDGVTKGISHEEALDSEDAQRSAYMILYELIE